MQISFKIVCNESSLLSGYKFSFYPSDTIIGNPIAAGLYEPYESRLFLDAIGKHSTVFDVGANIGYYTLLASKKALSGKIVAFEPNQKNYLLLEKNIRDNDIRNANIWRVAVSYQVGEAKLYLSKENQGDHQLYFSEGRESEVVMTTTIDAFVALHEVKPDVVKIDTQGFDYYVLLGMKKLLEESKDITLFTEFWDYGNQLSGVKSEEYFKLLLSHFRIVEFIDEAKQSTYPVDFQFVMDECKKYNGYLHVNLLCKKK